MTKRCEGQNPPPLKCRLVCAVDDRGVMVRILSIEFNCKLVCAVNGRGVRSEPPIEMQNCLQVAGFKLQIVLLFLGVGCVCVGVGVCVCNVVMPCGTF